MEARRIRSQVMSKFTALSVLALSICLAALALPALAQACSCAGPGSEDEVGAFYAQQIKDSDAAVIARVEKIRITGTASPSPVDDEAIFTVKVRKAFKRFKAFPRGRKVHVHTAANGAACGLEMDEGTVAGLFLYRAKGEWNGNLCGQISPRWMREAGAYADGGGPKRTSAGAGSGCSASAA
jgi:hypothetical protein